MEPMSDLEGYVLQVRDDPYGGRGIWTKLSPATPSGEGARLDIRAGREGHDVHLALVAGQTITAALLAQLLDALSAGRAPDVDYGCPPLDEASLELTREALRSAAPLLGAVLLGHLPAGERPSAVSARSAFRAAAPAISLALLSALPQGLRPDADETAEDEGGRAGSELAAALLQQDPLGTEAPWWVSEADGDLYATGHHGQSVHVGAMETPQHARLVCALRNVAPQLLQLLLPGAGLGPSAAPAPRPALSFAQAQALAAQGSAQDVARRILDLWEQVCPGPAALIGEDGYYQIDVGGRRVIAEAEDRPHGRYLAAAYSGAPVLALALVAERNRPAPRAADPKGDDAARGIDASLFVVAEALRRLQDVAPSASQQSVIRAARAAASRLRDTLVELGIATQLRPSSQAVWRGPGQVNWLLRGTAEEVAGARAQLDAAFEQAVETLTRQLGEGLSMEQAIFATLQGAGAAGLLMPEACEQVRVALRERADRTPEESAALRRDRAAGQLKDLEGLLLALEPLVQTDSQQGELRAAKEALGRMGWPGKEA